MKKYLLCCILCLMMLVVLGGCSIQADRVETDEEIRVPDETDEEALGEAADLYEAVERENLEELGEIISSEDGLYQVLVPSNWQLCENKIDESMMFELQGETEDQYMGILVLSDEIYGEFEIAAFMDAYTENVREQYGNAAVGKKEPDDINGNQMYSLRITGTIDDTDYINHIYVVDYENEKVIFTASTYPANETSVITALKDVMVSFQRAAAEGTEPES